MTETSVFQLFSSQGNPLDIHAKVMDPDQYIVVDDYKNLEISRNEVYEYYKHALKSNGYNGELSVKFSGEKIKFPKSFAKKYSTKTLGGFYMPKRVSDELSLSNDNNSYTFAGSRFYSNVFQGDGQRGNSMNGIVKTTGYKISKVENTIAEVNNKYKNFAGRALRQEPSTQISNKGEFNIYKRASKVNAYDLNKQKIQKRRKKYAERYGKTFLPVMAPNDKTAARLFKTYIEMGYCVFIYRKNPVYNCPKWAEIAIGINSRYDTNKTLKPESDNKKSEHNKEKEKKEDEKGLISRVFG